MCLLILVETAEENSAPNLCPNAEIGLSSMPSCQKKTPNIFNRKIKINHWNVNEHPKPEMGFLGFELKQCRGLSGAASLLLFLLSTSLQLSGLS